MKKSFKTWGALSLILSISVFLVAWSTDAQNKVEKKEKKKVEEPVALFTDGTPNSGLIHRDKLSKALKQPLVVKDKDGKEYPVIFFQYLYVNMGIFEDATGKMIVVPDYVTTYARDGKLPQNQLDFFDYNASFGDTLVIENVQFLLPDSTLSEGFAKGMRIFIDD